MKKQSVIYTSNNYEIHIKNRNKLLLKEGCVGGKTGWTGEAGRCLVALFERGGRRIVGVVLGSVYNPEDTVVFSDMVKMIDYSYNVQKISLINKDSQVKMIDLSFRIFPFFGPVSNRMLRLYIREPVYVYPSGEPLEIFFTINPFDIFKLDNKKPVGKLNVKQKEIKDEYSLYPGISSHDILRQDILPFYTACIAIIITVVLFLCILKMVCRKNK